MSGERFKVIDGSNKFLIFDCKNAKIVITKEKNYALAKDGSAVVQRIADEMNKVEREYNDKRERSPLEVNGQQKKNI